MPAAGGASRALGTGPAHDPRWAGDSERIAYLADDAGGNAQIHVASVATGADAEITYPSGGGRLSRF